MKSCDFPTLPRRRPLRSQTYRTFAQILTQCSALQSPQLPAAGDSSAYLAAADDIEEGQVSGDDETMDFLFHSAAEAREGFDVLQDVCVADLEKIKKKERKAKKKKKERIRRAEKNTKLGVKRVKLQPVFKPRKVIDCRHYMNGRCQMGDKCKFSHDKTPLTKSMPCCHFARGCCMKGDDCQYDHQLSKYPCRKHATDPPCLRADCKFSHEAALKSPVENSDLHPKQQLNLHSGRTHQQFDSSSMKILVTDLQKLVAVPKGISMISFGGSSSSSKSPMPVVEKSVVNLDQQATINSLNGVEKINEVVNYKVPMRPKGVNFLSFGNTPLKASQFDGHPHAIGESSFAIVGVEQSGSHPNNVTNKFHSFGGPKSSFIDLPQGSSCSSNSFSLLCSDNSAGTSFSAPKSALKALNSTLAFAAKLDSKIKLGHQALIR